MRNRRQSCFWLDFCKNIFRPMKSTLIISGAFISGILLGLFHPFSASFDASGWSIYVLYGLLFFAGIGIGSDSNSLAALKRMRGLTILFPFITILGALAGSIFAWLFLPDFKLEDVLAVGSGMGYYSLSSIMISEIRGETLGTIALISNLIREFITLLFAPLLITLFGKYGPIAAGGATSMDTSLAVIMRYSGREYTIISIYSGVVITFLVPVLVGLFMS